MLKFSSSDVHRGNEIRVANVTKLRNTRDCVSPPCVCLRSKRWIKPLLIYTADVPAEPWCSTFFVCRLLANRRSTNFFHPFPLSQLASRVFAIILSVKWSFLYTLGGCVIIFPTIPLSDRCLNNWNKREFISHLSPLSPFIFDIFFFFQFPYSVISFPCEFSFRNIDILLQNIPPKYGWRYTIFLNKRSMFKYSSFW